MDFSIESQDIRAHFKGLSVLDLLTQTKIVSRQIQVLLDCRVLNRLLIVLH